MSPTAASNDQDRESVSTGETDTVEDKLSELEWAEGVIKENTKKVIVTFHPTMIGLSAPFTETLGEDDELIQFNLANCNHNQPNSNKCYEIMNNVLDNVMGRKVDHSQTLGTDGQMLVIKWNKVNDSEGCTYTDMTWTIYL